MNCVYLPDEENDFFKSTIIGKTIVDIRGYAPGSNHISFLFSDGSAMRMFHYQNCSECVEIDDVCGDFSDLLNTPLLGCELVTSNDPKCGYFPARDFYDESYTWSFYKFKTIKGYVDLKWYGHSNGCYSETVDIEYYEPDFKDWEDCFLNY